MQGGGVFLLCVFVCLLGFFFLKKKEEIAGKEDK